MLKYKKLAFLIVALTLGFLFSFNVVKAEAGQPVNLYLFHWEQCPHCQDEREFLANLKGEYNNQLVIKEFEVVANRDDAKIYKKMSELYDANLNGAVPVTLIGDQLFLGYRDDQTTGQELKSRIDYCLVNECGDQLGEYLQSIEKTEPTVNQGNNNIPETIKVPILGEIDTRTASLPVLTIVIGLLDGFNPCAMWALVYLISLLLPMQNRRRMWLLGSSFIAVSGIVYFLFLAAWLNLFIFLGYLNFIRIIIGLLALFAGIYNLREYYLNRPGCKVTKSESQQRFFAKLREITQRPSLWIALSGIIILAFTINLVEAICSLGLPAIYTQVLSLTGMPRWEYYLYLLFYIFFFMLDDLIVFIVAMVTLRATGLSGRYSRFSSLIGGIIILLLGLLLIFKPGWLTFA